MLTKWAEMPLPIKQVKDLFQDALRRLLAHSAYGPLGSQEPVKFKIKEIGEVLFVVRPKLKGKLSIVAPWKMDSRHLSIGGRYASLGEKKHLIEIDIKYALGDVGKGRTELMLASAIGHELRHAQQANLIGFKKFQRQSEIHNKQLQALGTKQGLEYGNLYLLHPAEVDAFVAQHAMEARWLKTSFAEHVNRYWSWLIPTMLEQLKYSEACIAHLEALTGAWRRQARRMGLDAAGCAGAAS